MDETANSRALSILLCRDRSRHSIMSQMQDVPQPTRPQSPPGAIHEHTQGRHDDEIQRATSWKLKPALHSYALCVRLPDKRLNKYAKLEKIGEGQEQHSAVGAREPMAGA